jgi:hypothetical protein
MRPIQFQSYLTESEYLGNCLVLWEPLLEISHMLRTSMNRQRLHKSVSRQQPDKQDFHGNQQSQHVLLRAVISLGSASRQLKRRRSQDSPVSQQDASDQLTGTFPAVHFACSRGTFCKSQCNQRMELHWTARPIEQHSQQSSKQQRRQPTSTTSRPATATNHWPVTPRALHNASYVITERVNKSAYHANEH